jgi:hypothetical protein
MRYGKNLEIFKNATQIEYMYYKIFFPMDAVQMYLVKCVWCENKCWIYLIYFISHIDGHHKLAPGYTWWNWWL